MKRVSGSRRSRLQRSRPALKSSSKRGATVGEGAATKAGDPQVACQSPRFPTNAELRRLAALAKIKPESQTHFFGNIKELVQEAHIFHKLFHAGPKTYRAVLGRLRRIATHTDKLTAELQGIVEAGQSANGDPEKTFTYDFLNEAVDRSPGPLQRDQRLAEHIQQLGDFLAVSQRAEQQAKDIWGRKGRRAGAGGNYAFNIFVQQLYLNAWIGGGSFTNSRKKDQQQWSGSLTDALEILRPYLPKFFPPADKGRSAQSILDKLRASMKANRSKYRRSNFETKNRRLKP